MNLSYFIEGVKLFLGAPLLLNFLHNTMQDHCDEHHLVSRQKVSYSTWAQFLQ